jgi:hypothetical protein
VRAERVCLKKIWLIALERNREKRSSVSDSPLCGFPIGRFAHESESDDALANRRLPRKEGAESLLCV